MLYQLSSADQTLAGPKVTGLDCAASLFHAVLGILYMQTTCRCRFCGLNY